MLRHPTTYPEQVNRVRSAVAAMAVLVLLLSACTPTSDAEPPPEPKQPAGAACGPLSASAVTGRTPGFVTAQLARFDNDAAVCRGVWFPPARYGVIPQGLALDGDQAWVSGFDGSRPAGRRPCSVSRVDLRTGRITARAPKISGSIGGRPEVYCRHGGGLTLDEHGLWLAETTRLWLLDPALIGRSGQVIRAWSLASGVTGSFSVIDHAGRLGLGRFATRGRPRMNWFDIDELLDSPAITLTPYGSPGGNGVAAIARTRVPTQAQGATVGPGGKRVWFSRSVTTCAELVSPDGDVWAFIPGAEDFEFDGQGHAWVVSESGAERYQRLGRPVVPSLTRVDVSALTRGVAGDCGF